MTNDPRARAGERRLRAALRRLGEARPPLVTRRNARSIPRCASSVTPPMLGGKAARRGRRRKRARRELGWPTLSAGQRQALFGAAVALVVWLVDEARQRWLR